MAAAAVTTPRYADDDDDIVMDSYKDVPTDTDIEMAPAYEYGNKKEDNEDVDMIWRGDPHHTTSSELPPVYRVTAPAPAPAPPPLSTREFAKRFLDLSKVPGLEDGLSEIAPTHLLPNVNITDIPEGRTTNDRNLYELIQNIQTAPYIQRFLRPSTLSTVGKYQPPLILFTLYHSGVRNFTKTHKTSGIKEYKNVRKPVPANTTIIQFTKTYTLGHFTTFANFLLRAIKTKSNNDAFYDFLMDPTRAKFKSKIADVGLLDESFVATEPTVSGLHSYRDGETYPELYCELDPYAGIDENNITMVPGVYYLPEMIESLLIPHSTGVHTKDELNTIIEREPCGKVFTKLRHSSTKRYIESLGKIRDRTYDDGKYLYEGTELYDAPSEPTALTTFPELVSTAEHKLHFLYSDLVTALRGDSRIHPDRRIILFHLGCKIGYDHFPEEAKRRLRAESVSMQRAGKLKRRGVATTVKNHKKQHNRKQKQSITKSLNNRRHKHARKTRKQRRTHRHRRHHHHHRRRSHPQN